MLKTIVEKERITFVYAERILPFLLILLVFSFAAISIVLRDSLTSTLLMIFAFLSIGLLIAAYFLFQKKQVLVIDEGERKIEEYIRSIRQVFRFEEIEYADVERVREEEISQDTVGFLGGSEAITTDFPHLNYHPFLQFKNSTKKYFLLDNEGKGLRQYAYARKIVKTINRSLSISKKTAHALNLNQIQRQSSAFFWVLLFILLLAVGVLVFFVQPRIF